MKRKFISFLSLLIFLSPVHGTGFRFTNIGIPQGLSSSSVNVIHTDSRGFTWIGTNTGLNRFDGESFTLYTHHRNDSTSIPGDNVLSITEDDYGILWIGTDKGVARFNSWNGKAETIQQQDPKNPVLFPCNGVMIDKAHNIWAKSINALWKYDKKKNSFQCVLPCDGKNNHPDRCCFIYEDRKNRFWICSNNGLYQYNPVDGSLELFEINPGEKKENFIVSIFEDHDGILWCATWGQGFQKFLPDEKKFWGYKWNENPENPSAANIVFGYTETFYENNFSIWASTNNGLALMTDWNFGDYFHFSFIQNDPTNAESISSNQVNCIAGNKNGQLWAGTSEGVSVLLPERQLFHDYAPEFKGQTVRIIPSKNSGNFFCSWYGNGLQEINYNGILLRSWKRVPENSKDIDCSQVSDALKAFDGTMWVATFGGLSHGDAEGNNFKLILPEEGNPNSICDRHITCIVEDYNGKIWCGSYGKGISVLNPTDNSCVNYSSATNNPHSLVHDLVWSIYCTVDSGEIWIGTNAGLSHYDKLKKQFDNYTYALRGTDTLYFGICSNLYEDRTRTLWIGTDNGLFFRRKNGTFGCWMKEDGLADNHIRGIREDDQGDIWITTINGLSRLDPQTEKFTNFSIGSGLPVSSLDGDLGDTQNGKLLIGLNNRIVSFYPGSLVKSLTAPVFLTGISISGKPFSFEKNPSQISGSEFPWNENVISFDFVSPGLRGDPLKKYSYQLIGADKDWIVSGSRHYASYVGLPPGNYYFQCRASMNNGEWSKPTGFSFVIHPPFWKTWWFIISVCIITLSLTILIVRREATLKIRRQLLILEKQQAVEKERNRISRDMHDDLGSGLTKIAILSEVVKRKIKKDDSSITQIDTISESSRELVDNLNEIIWALNPDNDNLANLAAYIREYADHYLEPFEIRLRCEIPEQLPQLHLSEEKRRNIFLVVKEALHNIVKHADAKIVEIIFGTENGKLFIEVRDDGKGFEQSSARPLGNGLKSIQKRAAAIGATLEIKSKPGAGSSVRIIPGN